MAVETTELPGGLRVVTDAMPGLETASLGVYFAAGSRHESVAEHGLSHLLEHMAFKGTARRDARAIAESIENVGGDLNAATSVENTAYYAKVLREDCGLAMDVLADILTRSLFDAKELEREKQVILQEIAAMQDSPEELVFDLFNAAAFPDQPIGRPILGTAKGVKAFSRGTIQAYLDRHYTAKNCVIAAAGAVDHAAIRAHAESLFATLPGHDASPLAPANYLGGEILVSKKLEQTQVVIGFAGLSYADPSNYAAHIFANAVGGGMASPLFQEVREKRGLAYGVSAFHWSFLDAGLFGFEAGANAGDVRELIAVGVDVLGEAAQSLSETDMLRAKAQTKVALLTALESSSSRAEQIARQTMIFGRVLSQAEVIGKIDALTLEAVRAAGASLLRTPPTVAILGAVKKPVTTGDIAARLAGV
ncbi:peptidase M16 [Rhodoblastus sphagnicola]|uniref:Peptidase M16 n=1 Tax=Rhodoblastus sphagnicola TaxID=333368 RepID=A0A2S6NBN7_9HYPH|nr:pitrilysin family protein [Rhodoblastus sphagnicola]MBB4199689.1 putative Zn-dependent peptidase [Rhodoblastus sphagnicola]PPQ32026.1 peptidase M16 [Rhodoblastus sphagnicola]